MTTAVEVGWVSTCLRCSFVLLLGCDEARVGDSWTQRKQDINVLLQMQCTKHSSRFFLWEYVVFGMQWVTRISCLYGSVSVCLSVSVSLCLSVSVSLSLSLYLSIYLSIYFILKSVYPSIYLNKFKTSIAYVVVECSILYVEP